VGCLTWAESGLYACADQFVDGYTLGLSTDDGQTFTPLAELGSPCGPPPECAGDSSTAEECASRWPQEQKELNACLDGAGGGGGSAGTGGGDPGDDSCGCRIVADPGSDDTTRRLVAALTLLGGLGLALARRRSSP
jgi:hypothetical protein